VTIANATEPQVVSAAVDWNRQEDGNRTALPMSRDEAQQCIARIAHHLEEARALLLELYERQGWRALGYDSWRTCVVGLRQCSIARVCAPCPGRL